MRHTLQSLTALVALWGALGAPAAWAAGAKTSGSSQIVDDLPGAAAATVRATAGAMELDGAIGQVSDIITERLTPGATVEAGYLSRLVGAPTSAGFSSVHGSSAVFVWTDASPENPSGTSYVIDMATDSNFGGTLFSAEAFTTPGIVSGLTGNSTYYARIRSAYAEGDDSGFVSLASRITDAVQPAAGLIYDKGPYALKALWDPLSNSGGHLEGAWSVQGSTLPLPREGHALAQHGGRLYVAGGVDGSAVSTVFMAPILGDGSVGTWTATTPLPAARESHAMAAWGGRLYVAGGFDGGARSTVWFASILADGTLGAWTATAPLPAVRTKLAMAAWGGRLYVSGGDNGVFSQSTVYYADISDDGTLGAWSSGTALPSARSGHAMVVSSGTLFISGGVGAAVESTVWSNILVAGVPGSWNATTSMPDGRTRHGMAAANGKLYVSGGHDGSSARTTTWVGELDAFDNVMHWSTGTALPAGRYLHAMATTGNRLYVVGGSDEASTLETSLVTALTGSEYLAERAKDAGFTTEYSSSGWRPGTIVDFSSAAPNVQYFARVRARSFGGAQTGVLDLGSAITLAALPGSAASTFTAVEISSIAIQWTAGDNPGSTEYRAQTSTSSNFTGAIMSNDWTTAFSTSFANLAANTSYYVRVQARNSELVETPYTALGSTYTLAIAPVNTTITSSTPSGLTLEWSANGNPPGTRFEAQVGTSTTFFPVSQSSVTFSTSVVFMDLASSNTFYARVRALNGNGVRTAFDVTVSTATGLDVIAPGVSTGTLAFQSGAANGLLASWVVAGDNGYGDSLLSGTRFYVHWSTGDPAAVQWSTSAAQVDVATGPLTPGSRASVALTGLPDQKTVHFRVWTKDPSNNYSAPSSTFSAFSSPFSFESLEGGGGFDAGSSPSLAVDRSGDLHVVYRGVTGSQELRYIKRTGGNWGSAEAVDPGVVISEAVLALDASGNPRILYRETGTPRLKLAIYSGGWATQTIENGNFRPGGLVIDSGGRARFSYYDGDAGNLKYGRWTGVDWSTETVDGAGGDVGNDSALALDDGERPHISYYDTTNKMLRFASATTAGIWSLSLVDGGVDVGTASVVAIDGTGRVHIAYGDLNNQDVKHASWTGTGWGLTTVDGVGNIGALRLGLALDGAGAPVISYADRGDADLKVARWTGTGFSTQTIDSNGDQGRESSLALDSSGGVHVAYRNASALSLRLAHWTTAGVAAPFGGNARGRVQAPTGLSGAVVSSTSIQWSWTDNASNELGFALYGSVVSTGPMTLIAGATTILPSAGSGGIKSYVESGLTAGTTYYRYAVAVGSGGFVASAQASAVPFDGSDQTAPTYVNNQTGDPSWRRASTALYDVDLYDAGGAHLSKLQVKASTMPGGVGPDLIVFTDAVTNINADSYTTDWPLPSTVFAAMLEGVTNYVTIKIIDGNNNEATATDVFYVQKDTTAPTFVDNQADDDTPRMTPPPAADVDVFDGVSGLSVFQYSASTRASTADASVIDWTNIAALSNTTSYATDWSVDFYALAAGSRNYISVRSWDVAGTTRTLIDAFYVIRVASGPAVAITTPTASFVSALPTVSGTAYSPFGVAGVEVSFLDDSLDLYWDGASFNSVTPMWFNAVGTGTWSYASSVSFDDQGLYAVIARSSDTGGNYSAAYATASFRFDATAPLAGVDTPANGSNISSLAQITGTASDPNGASGAGVASVELRLRRVSDDMWWNFATQQWTTTAVSTAAAGTTTWSFTPSSVLEANLAHQTSYYVAVRASDNAAPANAGSFFAAGSSTFTFSDTTAPSAVTNLTGLGGAAPGEISLSWTAPGDNGDAGLIVLGEYRVQYGTFTPVSFSTASAQVVITTGSVTPGARQMRVVASLTPGVTYYIAMWTRDDADNWSTLSNGATVMATPSPSDQIRGHVVQVSSEGLTAVEVTCWNASDQLVATTFTLADGSGTYTLSGVSQGTYKIQATWSANGVASSVWIDGVSVGTVDLDFVLQLQYNLGTITGTLSTLVSGQSTTGLGASSFYSPQALPTSSDARIELFQGGRQVGSVGVQPSGRWTIPNLLPGRYAVRAFNGFDYTDLQEVDLGEGETRDVSFVFNPLPKEKVFAFPNPARHSTTLRFESSLSPLEAQISIFDITGALVKEIPGYLVTSPAAGVYHANWDLSNTRGEAVASGVYLFAVKVKGGADQTARVVKKLAVVR